MATREFDEDVLSTLVDMRIREQIPWKELPNRYVELVKGEEPPDWRTLQKAMLKDPGALIMPSRVHKHMRLKLEAEFDKADLGTMMIRILFSKYGEWNRLHDKMLRHAATTGVPSDEDTVDAPRFTMSDRERMDDLGNEIIALITRIHELMRSVNVRDNSIFELMETVQSGVIEGEIASESEGALEVVASRMIREAGEDTKRMVEEISKRHAAAGLGHYRPRAEEEPDLLEEG